MNTHELNSIQAAALVGVAEAIQTYADDISLDPYGEQRQYERDLHLQEHLRALAIHLGEKAGELLCAGK